MTRRMRMLVTALIAAIAPIAPAEAFQKCKEKKICDHWTIAKDDITGKYYFHICDKWHYETVCNPDPHGPTPLKRGRTIQGGNLSSARDAAVTRLPASGEGLLQGAAGLRNQQSASTGTGRVGR